MFRASATRKLLIRLDVGSAATADGRRETSQGSAALGEALQQLADN